MIDATQLFRDRVHGLLAHGVASHAVADVLGIRGVSEVWGGATPLDRPAWYLWLRGTPGAYRLSLQQATADGRGAAVARFALAYYPARAEPAFSTFSREERAFVESTVFDDTCTPRIERAHEIPADLFAVGLLEYSVQEGEGDAEVALVTMDRLRVRFEEEAVLPYPPLGMTIAHRRGDIARDVPGWRLALPVFKALAGLHAHVAQGAPSAVTVQRDGGTEQVYRNGAFDCVPTESVVLGEAVAQFRAGARQDDAAVCDSAAAALPLELGPEWWSLSGVERNAPRACCCCG